MSRLAIVRAESREAMIDPSARLGPIGIVDDDVSLLRALQRLLRAVGFTVETFQSAEEFLASERRAGLRCLVLDVHLGGMSGFDLHQRLASLGEPIPIVFITAHDDSETRERARRAGAVEYLRKPFDEQALVQAIHKAIDGA
jgi:FixJ family two-component response regulator